MWLSTLLYVFRLHYYMFRLSINSSFVKPEKLLSLNDTCISCQFSSTMITAYLLLKSCYYSSQRGVVIRVCKSGLCRLSVTSQLGHDPYNIAQNFLKPIMIRRLGALTRHASFQLATKVLKLMGSRRIIGVKRCLNCQSQQVRKKRKGIWEL